MKKGFICPDGQTCNTEDCLTKCRMGQRCAPKRYLMFASNRDHQDEVGDKFSVTELIKGTREAYLRRVKDYYEEPDESAYAVLGTKAHTALEAGQRLEWNGITGQYDDLDDEDGGTLVEYKTYGSYKMISVLGLEEQPTGAMTKTGKPKKEWVATGIPDREEMSLQLGMYQKMLAEKNVPVYHLKAHIIVRDGNLYVAKQRGIMKRTYYVDVPMKTPEEIEEYFMSKKEALDQAIKTGTMPVICSADECWSGNKCKDYCPVNKHCTNNYYLTEENK